MERSVGSQAGQLHNFRMLAEEMVQATKEWGRAELRGVRYG